MSSAHPGLERRRSALELDSEEFAEIGHRLVDDIAELLAGIRERPLGPGETPEEIRRVLNAEAALPEEGTEAAQVIGEATRLLFDHSVFNGHPGFYAYISGAAAPIGILSEMLAAAVNPNVGAWALSPMATEMEAQSVRWMADLVGYPAGSGVLTSGGNVANMLGFWAARAAKAGWDVRTSGSSGSEARPLVAYCGRGTHTWIQKAVDLSGMGTDSVRWVETDERGRMLVPSLRAAIAEDLSAGRRPFLVVGTAGSVGTGAIDPLPELRVICDEHDLWLHADGAYGAFAAASPEAPDDLRAMSLADSLALDPHKWLYAPLEAGCTMVRDPDALLRAFSYRHDYYAFGEGVNYYERDIQNSRGFRALKVWTALKQAGRRGYAESITQDIELARAFYDVADAATELEAFTHGLSITTYRYVPERLSDRGAEPDVGRYLNELNQEIRDRMEAGGEAFVSNAVLGDVYALRMCIVNFRTSLEDVRGLAELTVRLGAEVDAEMRAAAG